MKKIFVVITAMLLLSACDHNIKDEGSSIDQINVDNLNDAYAYLLGRQLVVRQEIMDMKEPGITYNTIKYNPLGSAAFVNPNFDVAYLESWIAVDENTPVIFEVPAIKDRYYTAQFLDEWGDVVANINQRAMPEHPFGRFTICLKGSSPKIPEGTIRLDIPSKKVKVLARVEIKNDPATAVRLQHQFKIIKVGEPVIEPPVKIPLFANKDLPGVSIFDSAKAVLNSASDIMPNASQQQARVMDVVKYIQGNAGHRNEVDSIIQRESIPKILGYSTSNDRNNWQFPALSGYYKDDYRSRAIINLKGLWANVQSEACYWITVRDSNGEPLNGSNTYILHFDKDSLPQNLVNSYWSVTLLSTPTFMVIPNPLKKYNLSTHSPLQFERDGSLNLYFSPALTKDIQKTNWLPTERGADLFLTFRTYVPKAATISRPYYPPALKKQNK